MQSVSNKIIIICAFLAIGSGVGIFLMLDLASNSDEPSSEASNLAPDETNVGNNNVTSAVPSISIDQQGPSVGTLPPELPSYSPSYRTSLSHAPSELTVAQQVALERSVLSLLYETTGGQSWWKQENWKNEYLSVCEWQGITCNENGLVSDVALKNNNLHGPLISNIGLLKELKLLEVNKNDFSGTIPSELGQLKNIERLILFDNKFSGSIPAEIFNDWKSLSMLFLSSNQLTGEIPVEVSYASNLVGFYVHNNKLSGSIPSEIGLLSQLASFYCFQNSLEGELPDELGYLPVISSLLMHNNSFVGNINYSSSVCGKSSIVGGTLKKLTLDCHSPGDSPLAPEILCDCCSDCYCDSCPTFIGT